MPSGEQFVSTIATIGIPSLRASLTAISSWPTSMMKTASGRESMSLMPPSARCSLSRSRESVSSSFFVNSRPPASAIPSSSFRRRIDCRIVLKFVSMPPSQRWLTYGIPQRSASSLIACRAARFEPTNSTTPLSATSLRTNSAASR